MKVYKILPYIFFSIYTISKYSVLWMKYPRKRYRYAEWYLIDIILNVIGGVFLCIYLQSVSILAWTKTDKIGLLLLINVSSTNYKCL